MTKDEAIEAYRRGIPVRSNGVIYRRIAELIRHEATDREIWAGMPTVVLVAKLMGRSEDSFTYQYQLRALSAASIEEWEEELRESRERAEAVGRMASSAEKTRFEEWEAECAAKKEKRGL